jgi:hypothetical protein
MKRYFSNFGVWRRDVFHGNYKARNKLNCFVNCMFGGDPRVTISLRTQRNADPISNLVNWIANLLHPGGVKSRPWGEGTYDDLELHWHYQIVVTVFWIIMIIGLIVVLWRNYT